jgi:hypothetical protein
LAFEGGDPAIVEEPILRGRSIVYASAASSASVDQSTQPPTPWTMIQTWPSFPPLVQEMLSLAVRGRSSSRNVFVGEEMQGVVHHLVVDGSLTIVRPDGDTERVSMTVDGESSHWMYNDWQSGMYEARYGAPSEASQWFAVNVNTRESSLERFDSELLPAQFEKDYQIDNLHAPQLPRSDDAQLFQYVLILLLVLLFSESILAWHFGRAKL